MKKQRRFARIQYRLEAIGWNAATWLLSHLPGWALVMVARFQARMLFDVLRIRRRITLSNLATAFPELTEIDRKRIGRKSYEQAVYSMAEFARLAEPGALEDQRIKIEVCGQEQFMELHKKGPLVIAVGHLGSWELLSHYWSSKGAKIAILYKPMHNPLIDRQFLRSRMTSHSQYLSTRTDRRLLWKQMKDAVLQGRSLAILGDQDARRDGVFVPFFGRMASTAAGPANVALRMNLPIVPMNCLRTGIWRFRIVFQPAILPPEGGRTAENVRLLTEQNSRALEQAIRLAPEQYMWVHDRWKTRPKNKVPQPVGKS